MKNWWVGSGGTFLVAHPLQSAAIFECLNAVLPRYLPNETIIKSSMQPMGRNTVLQDQEKGDINPQ